MSSIDQQTIALAAAVQAATLVEQLARTGEVTSDDLEPLLNALFVQSPEQFSDVYGNPAQTLMLGLNNLRALFGQSTRGISPDVTRYALSLIHLEKRLSKNPDMLNEIGQGIHAAQRQVDHFGLLHENTVAAIAEVYKQTLSNLSFRIHVTGNPTYLQNPATANRVRALLLAGIRAVILWRQVGGRRWQFILKKNAMVQAAKQLANTDV